MIKKIKKENVNSVFPLENLSQEPDFIEPLKLGKSNIQNPKVLRYDWQSLVLAEPRDNTNFKPPNGNLHVSSYRRLGPEKPETGISETRKRLEEIKSKDDYVAVYPRRSALNMFSHNLTEDQGRKETLRSSGFEVYPDDYGCSDYRRVSKIDYPLHFPMKPRPPPPPDKPWLFYRRTLSYNDQELSSRNCGSKFYDEEMNMHNKIAVMKIERHRSYDPFSKEFTNPCELAGYKFKI